MKWRFIPLLALLALQAQPALAVLGAPEKPTKQAASNQAKSNQARAGDLQILQLTTNDQNRFWKEWDQPTPPNLTTSKTVERNKPIFTFVIISGCKANAAGNCNLKGRFDIIDPDGLPYDSQADVTFMGGPAVADKFLMRLSPATLGLAIEDGEKLGKYTISVKVTDTHAKVTAETSVKIEVIEAK